MLQRLLVGILIGLLAGSGCAAPGLIVRTNRGREVRVDLQRVRPVHYEKEDLQKAIEPFAEHLAALVLQRERGLQLRLSAWSMPSDPLQRALIEGYLGICKQRGLPGDCWEVLDGESPGLTVDAKRTIALRMALSFGLQEAAQVVRNVNPVKVEAMMLMWFAFYLASFIIPDVTVTKLIFMTMSASLIAFLGVDGFRNIIQGYRTMREEAAQAQTFDQLRGAAERYGQRMGPSALRIATAIVTWGLCGATGLVTPISGLPGAAQAMANAEAIGFQLAAVNGGSVAVSATGTVTVVLAAQATASAWGGGATSPSQQQASGRQSDLSKAAGALDKGELTVAGRSLTKHGTGARPGNSKFPQAKGTPSQVNRQAQAIVDDILSNPGSTFIKSFRGRFGDTLEVTAPDGRGLVYDANGKFLFFKE